MKHNSVKSMIFIAVFAALTSVGALIKLPMWPVSLTLQFLMTAFAGVLLGGKRAAVSQLVYLLIGLIGVPVFTEGGGIGYLVRPSFGFLLGLAPAAYVIGVLSQKRSDFLWLALSCFAGLAALYLFGLPYMYLILKFYMGTGITVSSAIYSGMLVFLPGDVIKIALVSGICVQVRKRAGKLLA